MKINYFSAIFWFNIVDNHLPILEKFQKELNDEYKNFNINNTTNNLLAPIIMSVNEEKKTNFSMSKINLQFSMDNVLFEQFSDFKEKTLKIFEILSENNIEILHSAVFINCEISSKQALDKISDMILNKKIKNKDLVDVTIKLGKKEEDLFYKIVTLLNKKKIKLPKKLDDKGRLIPIPLISWNNASVEDEIIDVSYELNDKYSFDFTKNYHTTEFYLNKMLYLLENNYYSDIEKLISKGEL